MTKKMENNPYILKSVTNALRVLEALGNSHRGEAIGLSDLARQLGIGKSTCHRLLITLESRGFASQEQSTGKYKLGPKNIQIAGKYLEGTEISSLSKPILEKLVDKTGETAHIAVLDGKAALFVAKVDSDNPFRMMSHVGWRAPLHSCALGKVLLAFNRDDSLLGKIKLSRHTKNTITDRKRLLEELKEIRSNGWAIDDEEVQLGLRCYAAPIKNFEGEVVAAVSVSGPKVRSSPNIKEHVVQAAREISFEMGYLSHRP
jgi:IclR family KDG regulon transcriptional repressor